MSVKPTNYDLTQYSLDHDVPVSPIPYGEPMRMSWGPLGDPIPPQIIEIHDDGSKTMVCWNERGPYRTVRVAQNGRIIDSPD